MKLNISVLSVDIEDAYEIRERLESQMLEEELFGGTVSLPSSNYADPDDIYIGVYCEVPFSCSPYEAYKLNPISERLKELVLQEAMVKACQLAVNENTVSVFAEYLLNMYPDERKISPTAQEAVIGAALREHNKMLEDFEG